MMTADWPDPEVVSKLRGGEREDDRVIIQRDGRIGLVAVIVWVTAPTPPADAIEVGLRVWRRLWAHAYGASPAEMRVKVTRQTEQEERDRIERKWKRQQEKRRKEGRNSGHRKP